MNCRSRGFLLPRAIKGCCIFSQRQHPRADDSWQSHAYPQSRAELQCAS